MRPRFLDGASQSRRLAMAAVAGAVGAFTPAALAQLQQAPVEPGLTVGVRLGVAVPMGETGTVTAEGGSSHLAYLAGTMVPAGLEVGYRITPHVQAGAFVQYAFGGRRAEDNFYCSSCTVRATTFGASVRYHGYPGTTLAPWVGFGLGWETVRFEGVLDLQPQSLALARTAEGLQFCVAETGGDLRIGRRFTIGPFVGVSLGVYSRWSQKFASRTETGEVRRQLMHGWLNFGLRSQFIF